MQQEVMIANQLDFESAKSLIRKNIGAVMRREPDGNGFCVFYLQSPSDRASSDANARTEFHSVAKIRSHSPDHNCARKPNIISDRELSAIPRIRLLQPRSPQIIKGEPDYIAGASAGDFISSLTRDVIVHVYVANLFMQTGFAAFKKREFGAHEFQGNHASKDAAIAHIEAQGLNPLEYDIRWNHTHALVVIDEVAGRVKTPILFNFQGNNLTGFSNSWNNQIVAQNPTGPRFLSIWKPESLQVNRPRGSYFEPRFYFAGCARDGLAGEIKAVFDKLVGRLPLIQDGDPF